MPQKYTCNFSILMLRRSLPRGSILTHGGMIYGSDLRKVTMRYERTHPVVAARGPGRRFSSMTLHRGRL